VLSRGSIAWQKGAILDSVAIGRCDVLVHSRTAGRGPKSGNRNRASGGTARSCTRHSGNRWLCAASVNWFIPAPRARNRSTRKGVPTYRIVVAEIDRRRRVRTTSGLGRNECRANPKRETAPGETTPHVGSRWQNREIGMGRGACEHLGDGLRKESARQRVRTVGDSERREPVSAMPTKLGNERSRYAQSDRRKPLPDAEIVHFSRVNDESVLGRTDPHFRFPKGAEARRRGDRSVRGWLDSRTNEERKLRDRPRNQKSLHLRKITPTRRSGSSRRSVWSVVKTRHAPSAGTRREIAAGHARGNRAKRGCKLLTVFVAVIGRTYLGSYSRTRCKTQ